MDKLEYFKDGIYNIAMEKQALSLGSVVNAGKKLWNAGLGTKMAVGAGAGGVYGLLRQPGQDEDRLSNAVSGMFGGATMGLAAHGVAKGLKDVKMPNTTLSIPKVPTSPTIQPQTVKQSINTGILNPNPSIDWGQMNIDAGETIDKLYMEKLAAPTAQIVDSFGNSARKFYNKTLGGGVVKNTIAGAGIGATVGAIKHDPEKEDGSFSKSKFGSLASGALAGAGSGLESGLLFKKVPLKTVDTAATNATKAVNNSNMVDEVIEDSLKRSAEYKELVFDVAMEKKATSIGSTVMNGVADAIGDFKKLDEVYRVIIGSGIGGTIGTLLALNNEKNRELNTKDKIKTIGKAGMEGALIGATISGTVGFKPGQLKKEMN
jgi:hypothetical protein